MGYGYSPHMRQTTVPSQASSPAIRSPRPFQTQRFNARASEQQNLPPENTDQVSNFSTMRVFPESDSSHSAPETSPIQTKRVAHSGQSSNIAQSTGKTGEPIPGSLRRRMERAFRSDFSDVKVHKGTDAKSLGAVAFTQGRDIHFAPGEYTPESIEGQKNIGHELAHVVQQQQGLVSLPQHQRSPINADPALENQADTLGEKVVDGEHAQVGGVSTTGSADAATLGQTGATGGPIQLGKNKKKKQPISQKEMNKRREQSKKDRGVNKLASYSMDQLKHMEKNKSKKEIQEFGKNLPGHGSSRGNKGKKQNSNTTKYLTKKKNNR